MTMMKRPWSWAFVLLLALACDPHTTTAPPTPAQSPQAAYESAIADAVFADSAEICRHLVAIRPDRPGVIWSGDGSRVLVVTWTKYPSSFPAADTVLTSWGDLWVTSCPEMAESLKSEGVSSARFVRRVEEMLGLPPDKGYTHFAELWVRPADLFRPAYDPDIADTTCGLSYPSDIAPDYVAWFEDNIIDSYFPPRYPWTRLGYTYDWGGPDEIGLSEFVLKKSSHAIVKATYSNDQFYVSKVR
jgi:hypothetical protein